MPYPLIIAGLAMSAAGAGVQIAGAEESRKAMNSAVDESLARQQQFSQQGRSVFEKSLTGSTPQTAQDQMAEGRDRALNEYQSLQAKSLTGETSAVPFESNQSATNVDKGRTGLSNLAQASLQGYSEWDLQRAIKNLTAEGQLGLISNNARNVASMLPYQVQAASHAGDSLSGIGSLLGTAGGLVGMFGALAPAAAAGTTASTTGTITPAVLNNTYYQPFFNGLKMIA
jgi:hypothetical protein